MAVYLLSSPGHSEDHDIHCSEWLLVPSLLPGASLSMNLPLPAASSLLCSPGLPTSSFEELLFPVLCLV